ncbi:hypothetical protein [Rhodococcus sp. ABRD24]|nr:hypothetical protein [Rhodococcus sp. ABRD24]
MSVSFLQAVTDLLLDLTMGVFTGSVVPGTAGLSGSLSDLISGS